MTEDDARRWIEARFGRAALERLAPFVALVVAENQQQNLIAPSTVPTIWSRHVVDSAQLMPFDQAGTTWLDIGTGGGFPGIVVALLRSDPVALVEPRTKRAAFLRHAAERLALTHVDVRASKVEAVRDIEAGVISARAVATLDGLFTAAQHCAGGRTRWLLPKGRSVQADLAEARRRWSLMFHVEQSVVDAESSIVVIDRVTRR